MNHKFAVLICFIFFFLLYGITSRADLQLTDEVAVFASAVSLAEEGNLSIDELQWLNIKINLGDTGQEGRLYAKYFPGNILTSAVVYRFTRSEADGPYVWNVPEDIDSEKGMAVLASSNAGARSALKVNAVYGALAMTVLFLLLLRHFNWKTAATTVLLVGICTDWWYQSRGFLSEVGAGAFLICSLYFTDRQKPHVSGLMLGVSLLFRPTNLIGFPVWLRSAWEKKSIWSIWGIAVGGMGLAAYNWVRFGSPFDFGYQNEGFLFHLVDGLYGVLLSPGRSFFVYSPILSLAIPGAWLLFKKEKSLSLAAAVTVVLYILMAASWHSWDGGWSWGARLLTPILPMMGFLSAPAIDSAWARRGDLVVIFVMAMFGLVVQLMALVVNPLETLVTEVVYNHVSYNETVNSIGHSWIALQWQTLKDWQFCEVDSYTLRQWVEACRGY